MSDKRLLEYELRKWYDIQIDEINSNSYKIIHPFHLDNLQSYHIFLRKKESGWEITDQGYTLFFLDLKKDQVKTILESNGVVEKNGELVLKVAYNQFCLFFYYFLCCLQQIEDFYSQKKVVEKGH